MRQGMALGLAPALTLYLALVTQCEPSKTSGQRPELARWANVLQQLAGAAEQRLRQLPNRVQRHPVVLGLRVQGGMGAKQMPPCMLAR